MTESKTFIITDACLTYWAFRFQPELAEKVSNLLKTLDHHPDQESLQDLLKEFCSLEHVPNPDHANRYWRIRMLNPR